MFFLNLSKGILGLVAFVALLPVISRANAQEASLLPVGSGKSLEFCSGLEKQAFFLVNEYRRKNKLPPLSWDKAITQVAREHSKNMAAGKVDFGHDGFSGRVSRLQTTLTGLKGCGENVLRTDNPEQTAQNAVELWLQSPAHLHNIRGDYNSSGLGVWQDRNGMIYFTQIFVKTEPSTQAAQAEPEPKVTSPFGLLAPAGTRTQP